MFDLVILERELANDLIKEDPVLLRPRLFVLRVVEVSVDQNGIGRLMIETDLKGDGT